MIMETVITLKNIKSKISPKFRNDDYRYPESFVRYVVKKYSKKGDTVIDPFAGLGTTLIVAEKLGRIPFGIEIDAKRCGYIKTKIKHKKNIMCGSSLQLDTYKFPQCDLCLTSPPYNRIYEKNYLGGKGGYKEYLADIRTIYEKLKSFMKKDAYVILEVSNLKGKTFTPLAWDIAQEVSKVFHFEGEIIIRWEMTRKYAREEGSYGYGYDHSYCLVFKNL